MSNDFGFGVTVGFLIGTVLMTAAAITIRDRGRDECDQNLPRNEACVQQWVPPKAKP